METMRNLETLEIVGGALCLDFANTINSRYAPEHDYLMKYSDLADWALKIGILSESQRNRLHKESEQDARQAKNVLQKALLLRELLYRLFLKMVKGSPPNPADLTTLVEFYAEATVHSKLIKQGEHFVLNWSIDETLDAVLWPIIDSGVQVLSSSEVVHVKECPGCGWLFLDTSKNHSRRWCSMNACGARDKMRRYHRRLRTRLEKRR